MKTRKLQVVLFTGFALISITAIAQMNYWSVQPNVLYFNPSPTSSTLPGGTTNQYLASNSAYDYSGNLLFYVVLNQAGVDVFSNTGTLVGALNAIAYTCNTPNSTSDRPDREVTIIPRPGYCKQFYVIWCASNSDLAGISLGYAIIDCSSSVTISQQSTLIKCNGGNYGSFAVSKIISGNRYLLWQQDNFALTRFTITGAGFTNPTTMSTDSKLAVLSDEFEIAPNQNSIAWVKSINGDVYVADVNITGGSISNIRTYTTASSAQGIEFDASSSRIFASCSTGVYYKDISAGSGAMTLVSSSSSYNKTQLELGKDNLIYAVNNTGSLGAITTSGTPSIASAGLGITLFSNIGHAFAVPMNDQSYTLPDQIDGENYNWIFTQPQVSINQSGNLCAGSTIVLSSTVTPSGIPVTYAWSTSATTANITVSSGGTYTLTVTNDNGCSASATTTVTQRPVPIIAPLTTDPSNRCTQQGDVTLTASPGAGNQATFSSYQWSGAGLTGNLSSSTVTATPQTSSTTYTVTVTSNYGCTSTQSITINWNTSCCTGSTITCGGHTVSLTYGDVNISKIYQDVCGTSNTINLSSFGTDKQIAINGKLTVDGSYTFLNCYYTSTTFGTSGGIRFSPTASIFIDGSKSLTIDHSYLYACSDMWAGIVLIPGGTLNVTNTSIIADAVVAINGGTSGMISGMGLFTLTNSNFYRNWVAVNIPASMSSASTVNGCNFSYVPGNALSGFMLNPHSTQRPAVGIFANYISGSYWNVTNQTGGTANTFDGINNGIYVYQSNVRVNNNNFNNIRNYDNVNASSGKAVYCASVGFPVYGNSVWVQTNSDQNVNPVFNNCDYGVYVTTANGVVQNNKMGNVTYGIYGSACQSHNLDFNHNVISGTLSGITFNNVLGQYATPKAQYNNVTTNEPDAFNLLTYGIAHFETTNTSVTCNGGTRDCRPLIELNTLNDGRYGVYISNAYGTRVTNNTISQQNTVSTTQTKAGIYVSGANMPLITINSITGNGNTYDESANASSAFRRSGVRMLNSTAELCNNTFNTIGYATEFIAGCSGTQLKQSQINACRYGVVLKNNGATGGVIGEQGATNLTHGNIFNGDASHNFNNTGNFRTYCFNSDGSFSPFRVSNVTTSEPQPNGTNSSQSAITKTLSSTSTAWSCAFYKSLIITQGDLYSKEVAEGNSDEYMEFGFEESGKWLAEKNLYERLKQDEQLLHSKQLYEDFYSDKQHEPVGQLGQVDNAALLLTDTSVITDSVAFENQRQNALSINSQINATTQQDQNRKRINEIYLNTVAKGITEFTANERQDLYNLAIQCPYVAGDAVYSARSLYNLINHTAFFDDEEICNEVANFKKEQAKKLPQKDFAVTISPNPASSNVDIVVKGSKDNVLMTVYNSLGEVMGVAEINHYVQFNVSEFPNGVYQLQFITADGAKYTTRLIVTK